MDIHIYTHTRQSNDLGNELLGLAITRKRSENPEAATFGRISAGGGTV